MHCKEACQDVAYVSPKIALSRLVPCDQHMLYKINECDCCSYRDDVFCVICCIGPEGPALRLPSQNLLPGLPVMMVGFLKASITDIKSPDSSVAAKGHINAIPTSMEVALADYHGGMF